MSGLSELSELSEHSRWLRRTLSWRELRPALIAGLWALALFGAGLWLARQHADAVLRLMVGFGPLAVGVFVATTALAVVLPLASNLPLVPIAALAWGPGWTAALLLLGWIIGSALSFGLGRWAREAVLRRLPSVQRHVDIERLIHPQHRLASLISLRMTFPVDVLSYALGLFSPRTTLFEVALSTLVGAAPFALLFAWFPTLSVQAQWAVFGVSLLLFVVHLWWVLPGREPAS